MNKKGQYELGASYLILFCIVLFAIVLLVFFILFSVKNGGAAGEKVGSVNFNELEARLTLMNLLKTPVEIEGEKMTMADFILIWYYDQDKYNVLLGTELNKILNLMSSPTEFYYVGITEVSEKGEGKTKWITQTSPIKSIKEITAVLNLPMSWSDTEIKVTLVQQTEKGFWEAMNEVDPKYAIV